MVTVAGVLLANSKDCLYQCQGLSVLLCVLSQAVTEHRADEVIVCYTNVLDAAIMDCSQYTLLACLT